MNECNLYLGDCLEVMKMIPCQSIDAIICDLPYGATRNKWDVVIHFELMWEQYNRIIKPHGTIALFCQQPFETFLINSNIKNFRYCWTWFKHQTTGFLNAKKQPLRNIENIAVFSNEAPIYYPQMRKGKMRSKGSCNTSSNYEKFQLLKYKNDTYYPTQVLDFAIQRKGGHPTQKPVALLEYLVKTYTLEGETVLDNCMGSGTTGVACKNTNRNFIGIEKEPKYYEMARSRIFGE